MHVKKSGIIKFDNCAKPENVEEKIDRMEW